MNIKFKKLFSTLCLLLVACTLFSLCACNNDIEDGKESSSDEIIVTTNATDTAEYTLSSTAETTATESTAPTESTVAETTGAATAVNPNGTTIIGAGSKSQPYMETPDSSMTVTTVSIPAGQALYYSIYRVGGKILTINSSNAYVIYNGTRYNASNGKVSFVVGSALASDAVSFQIGNSGSSAASFKIRFSDTYGSYGSPETISKLDGKQKTTSLSAGCDGGYYYKYVAEKNGTIRFYVSNAPHEFLFNATRHKSSDGMLVPIQVNFEADPQSDSNGNYIELEVLKGETVMINISSYPNGSYYPAVTVKWYGKYV